MSLHPWCVLDQSDCTCGQMCVCNSVLKGTQEHDRTTCCMKELKQHTQEQILDAVERVQAAADRTTKTVMVQFADKIKKDIYWSTRLSCYFRDLPGQVECEATIAAAHESLDAIEGVDLCVDSVARLEGVLAMLPDMRAKLRLVTLKVIETAVVAKVLVLAEQCKNVNKEVLDRMSVLAQQASISFPLSKQVNESQALVLEALQNYEQSVMVKQINQWCGGALQEQTPEQLWQYLQQFMELASSLQPKTATQCATELVKVIAHSIVVLKECLGLSLLDLPLAAFAECCKHAVEISVLLHEEGKTTMNHLQSLKYEVVQLQKALVEVGKAEGQTLCRDVLKLAKDKLKGVGDQVHQDATTALNKSIALLNRDHAKAKPFDAQCAKEKSISALAKLANETLLQVDPTSCERSYEGVKQVASSKNANWDHILPCESPKVEWYVPAIKMTSQIPSLRF
eukprot:2014786-Amphidinium_carterae.2